MSDPAPETPSEQRPASGPTNPPNVWFRAAAISAGIFAVTMLIQIAVLFGDGQAPPARFMDAYGTPVLGIEIIAILITGVLGMVYDTPALPPQS